MQKIIDGEIKSGYFGKDKDERDKNFEKVYGNPLHYVAQNFSFNRSHIGEGEYDFLRLLIKISEE